MLVVNPAVAFGGGLRWWPSVVAPVGGGVSAAVVMPVVTSVSVVTSGMASVSPVVSPVTVQ